MSDRLNKGNRAELLRKLTDKAFKAKFEALTAKKRVMYGKLMGDLFRAEAKWLAAAPEGGVPTRNSVKIKLRGDSKVQLIGAQLPVPHAFHEDIRWSNSLLSWDSLSKKLTAKFAGELKTFLDECVALDKEHEKFKSEARAVLDSVTTVKRLYEVWPELNELMPPVVDQTVSVGQQLAPVTADLNRALGIGNGAKS